MKQIVRISICVPAFNEEKSLRKAVEDLFSTLRASLQELEVIIVNDGSTDGTSRLAEHLAKEHSQVKVIHHLTNLGIGSCYRDVLAVATGNFFTWFPADHENSAEEFIQCLPYLRSDSIVTCYHCGQDPRSVFRRWISYGYSRILNKFFHLNLKYYNGLTIFPTSALRSFPLVANGFIFSAETLIYAVKYGCRIVQLPAPLRKRISGKSKLVTFVSFYQILNDIFRIFSKQKMIKGKFL